MFIRNFNMNLEASGTLKADAKIQCLRTLVRVEVLRQFDVLSAEVESASLETLTTIILRLGTYYFSVNALSKQKRVMCRGIRNLCSLKVRRYAASLVDLNE